jgi:predicted DNA helicase
LSDERYNPGFLNEEEHRREQQRVKDMVQGLAENRALTTENERESNREQKSRESSAELGLIDELIRIVRCEKEKSILDRSDESKRFRANVFDISEGVVTLKCDQAQRFEKDAEVACVKDRTLIGKGIVSDNAKDFLSVTIEGEHRLAEGSDVEVAEVESVISFDLQLDLLEKIKRGNISGDNTPISFFLDCAPLADLPNENDRVKLEDRNAVDEPVPLDDSQVEAVECALSLRNGEFLLIIGPPGTGKTKVIKKIAVELMRRHEKVLITSHTNIAVDNAIEGLPLDQSLRVGRPRRVIPKEYLLSYRARHPTGVRYEELETEVEGAQEKRRRLLDALEECSQGKGASRDLDESMCSHLKSELGNVNRRLRELETERHSILKAERRNLVSRTPIIGSTLVASQLSPLSEAAFDTVIIDECSQASIPLALLSLTKGRKWILVGDHKQLLPILKCVRDSDLERFSVFNHLKSKYGNRSVWLKLAYRSNTKIVDFAAEYVYERKIQPFDPVQCDTIKLCLNGSFVQDGVLDPDRPVVFVHVDGKESREGNSRYNQEEVEICISLVNMLIDCGVKNKDIGVIAPFKPQARELATKIKGVEVKTVDSFQGREKDVIIFSITATSDFDFVSNVNRLNVALTRPRCKLIVVGNGKSIYQRNKEFIHTEEDLRRRLLVAFLKYSYTLNCIYSWDKKEWMNPLLT